MEPHRWQFVRAGGVDQVVIRTGADIAHLAQLDQKLWVALACPTRGVEFDAATLDAIDSDGDGRIRAPELLAACQWAVAHVRDPEVLTSTSDVLQLDSLQTEVEDGPAMLAEAQRILALAGQANHLFVPFESDAGDVLRPFKVLQQFTEGFFTIADDDKVGTRLLQAQFRKC